MKAGHPHIKTRLSRCATLQPIPTLLYMTLYRLRWPTAKSQPCVYKHADWGAKLEHMAMCQRRWRCCGKHITPSGRMRCIAGSSVQAAEMLQGELCNLSGQTAPSYGVEKLHSRILITLRMREYRGLKAVSWRAYFC